MTNWSKRQVLKPL